MITKIAMHLCDMLTVASALFAILTAGAEMPFIPRLIWFAGCVAMIIIFSIISDYLHWKIAHK